MAKVVTQVVFDRKEVDEIIGKAAREKAGFAGQNTATFKHMFRTKSGEDDAQYDGVLVELQGSPKEK